MGFFSSLIALASTSRAEPIPQSGASKIGVVFTGAYGRIDVGLKLLAEHQIQRLFISGVNAGAGLWPDRLVELIVKRNPSIANVVQLIECCVDFGVYAQNTLQNAAETKCWLDRVRYQVPIVLITSARHMPRAYLTLTAAAPRLKIEPYPAPNERDENTPSSASSESIKYILTLTLLRLPWLTYFTSVNGDFARGCPPALLVPGDAREMKRARESWP